MLRARWTVIMLLVGGISAVLLNYFRQIPGFPQDVMLVFWPAEYVWNELKIEAYGNVLRPLAENVAVFAVLASLQGALVGFLLDTFVASRRGSLDARVRGLRHTKDRMDPGFRRRVLAILGKYDPAGLAESEAGRAVYEPQMDTILVRLRKMRGASDVQKFCRQQFRRDFGGRALRGFGEYDSMAKEIWNAYRKQRSAGRGTAPARRGL